ncbi:leucine-rich_repeat domain-containing protein [Hexamita inflata]|uniref:Leucine-rich repeat domain-containing protein n=1 Tax=Hexamita inflata TaxID=28002 RepID=A0AA86UQE9_9EUKA|nr:leucine-rich repeat domain-containing protein [Hexamita inflata]
MIQKYKNDVKEKTLQIFNDEDLFSIKFVEHLIVNELSIVYCSIKLDFVPNQLSILVAFKCGIEEVGTLGNNLQKLYLNQNKLKDVKFAQFSQLKVLQFDDNNVSDLQPLNALFQLEELSFYRNKVSNLSPLTKLHKLTKFQAGQNYIIDITPLKTLYNLQIIELNKNQIIHIDALEKLNQLYELDLRENLIVDLKPIYNHLNRKQYIIKLQTKPTKHQIFISNKLKAIQNACSIKYKFSQQSKLIKLDVNQTRQIINSNIEGIIINLASQTNIMLNLLRNRDQDVEQ